MVGMVDQRVQEQLQAECELGQEQLIATDYLAAAATLTGAEAVAWDIEDFDTLARLYMPLQEARRQIRLRCGEGVVATYPAGSRMDPLPQADRILDQYPQGQLLPLGLGPVGVQVSAAVRQRAAERGLYVETFLAGFYPVIGRPEWSGTPEIGIVPTADVVMPRGDPVSSPEALREALPPGSLVFTLGYGDWPAKTTRGTPETFAKVSALWERLHAPFLAAADAEPDPVRRMALYRRTIEVDPACEFAHQRLSTTARDRARQLARRRD
jgi:hypothetical protein